MFVPLRGKPTWRFHSQLYKFQSNVSANNSTTEYRTDLRLGEVVHLLIFYSGVPLLSKFRNLSSQEILVVTCSHVTYRPFASQGHQCEVAQTWDNPVLYHAFLARSRMVARVLAKTTKAKNNFIDVKKVQKNTQLSFWWKEKSSSYEFAYRSWQTASQRAMRVMRGKY